MSHRLAELAVARNVDAGVTLTAYNIGHRGLQQLLEAGFVRPLARVTFAIGFNQVIWARQAPDVAGENMITTITHAACSRLQIRFCGSLARRAAAPGNIRV